MQSQKNGQPKTKLDQLSLEADFRTVEQDLTMMFIPIVHYLYYRDMMKIEITNMIQRTEEKIKEEKKQRYFQSLIGILGNDDLEVLVNNVGGGERLIGCMKLLKEYFAFKNDHYDKIKEKVSQLQTQSVEVLNLWQVRATTSNLFEHIDFILPTSFGHDEITELSFKKYDTFYVFAKFNNYPKPGEWFFVRRSSPSAFFDAIEYGFVRCSLVSKIV